MVISHKDDVMVMPYKDDAMVEYKNDVMVMPCKDDITVAFFIQIK